MIRKYPNPVPEYDFFCLDNENTCDHINIIHERIRLLSKTLNDIIVPQETFPSVKELQKIKHNTRIKNIMKRIMKRNENNYNYIIIEEPPHAPVSEHLTDVEIDFLSNKGYKVFSRITDKGYYCKISW